MDKTTKTRSFLPAFILSHLL